MTTVIAIVLVYAPSYFLIDAPDLRGVLRTVGLLAVSVIAVAAPRRR